MDAAELEAYRYQLEQVELALSRAPEDSQLKKLRNDLAELISLSISQPVVLRAPSNPVPASAPAPTKRSVPITLPASLNPETTQWAVDDWILAKWSGDGKWYPAKVTSVGGSQDDTVYSVQFKGYNETEIVRHEDTRAKASTLQAKERQVLQKLEGKRDTPPPPPPPSKTEQQGPPEKKRKQQKKKESEHTVKQKAWLEFAKSGKKKIDILGRKSMFSTEGVTKVGIINSGKPMTTFTGRSKYKFAEHEEDYLFLSLVCSWYFITISFDTSFFCRPWEL